MSSSWRRLLFFAGVLLALFFSRWPLIHPWLVNFDSANFAFALEVFDPGAHKPQPPGYPLYVGLTRLIRLFANDVALIFPIAGLIGSVPAVLAVAWLAALMFGRSAAIAAAALMIFHPAFWTAGILNPVRVYLVTGSALLGLLAWKLWSREATRFWALALWLTLGLSAGFRPVLLLLMLPLCVAAQIRWRNSFRDWLQACALLAIGAGSWLIACVYASGGVEAYVRLLTGYVEQQSESTSIFFGASLPAAIKMAWEALIWTAAPIVSWISALRWIKRSSMVSEWKGAGIFMILWAMPALLFFALIHSAEPGHILPLVAPVSLVGGWALSKVPDRLQTAAVVIAVLCNAALFFRPPVDVLRPASAFVIRLSGDRASGGLNLVQELAGRGPLTLVASPAATVPWRVLSYYYRNLPVIVLHSEPDTALGPTSGYWIIRQSTSVASGQDQVELPECGTVVWFLSERTGMPSPEAKRIGFAIVSRAAEGEQFRLGAYEFIAPKNCAP